jgi:hypothetical protein
MGLSDKIIVAVIGAAATSAATRAVTSTWEGVMGTEPPDVHDPEVPTGQAVVWAVASGIALGIVQLLVSRYASRKYQAPSKAVKITL